MKRNLEEEKKPYPKKTQGQEAESLMNDLLVTRTILRSKVANKVIMLFFDFFSIA